MERFANGAVIAWNDEIGKYAVLDFLGHRHALKRNLDEARALAQTLPGKPYRPPEPPRSDVSPHAHAEVKARHAAPAGRAGEPGGSLSAAGYELMQAPRSASRSSAPRPEPSWGVRYNDRLAERQRVAFAEVYGKHLGRRGKN